MNSNSLTNGALARIMPLAVWTSSLETSEEVKQAVVSEVELSHAHPVVQEMIFVYCDTVRYLICNLLDEDRAQEAFNHAQELSEKPQYAGSKSKFKKFNCADLLTLAQNLSAKADKVANDSNFLDKHYSCMAGQQGAPNHVASLKHAFVLSFYFLLRSSTVHDLNHFYEKALLETIKLGGDTDGNAAVVCGLIGALVGVRRIPRNMLSALFSFDDNGDLGQDREGHYCVRDSTLKSIDRLIQIRPEEHLSIKRQEVEQ